MKQKTDNNKPLEVAMNDFYQWVNANIFGKIRSSKDAFEFDETWLGSSVLHDEADVIKNCSADDINLALALNDSLTNMLLVFDSIKSGEYLMVNSHKEIRLGTAIATNTVANVGSPVTSQTITLSGLSTSTYYVMFIPTKRASKLSMSNAGLINNTAVLLDDGFPQGFTGIMFLPTSAAPVITLTAPLGVGLATGTNTQLKLYPVTAWTTNTLKILSASN